METIKSITIGNEKLELCYDESPENPRDWTNLGYFITCDSNYDSPDDNAELKGIIKSTGDMASNQSEHIKLIKDEFNQALPQDEKVLAIYPVVKHEHGDINYSIGHKQGFDYSNNGFYIVTDKTRAELGTEVKDFKSVVIAELEVYNKYVNGDVYEFTISKLNFCETCENLNTEEVVESINGLYSIEDVIAETDKKWHDELSS